MNPPTESATPVLVVGAGPVGLTLAAELLRHGVRCRVIDMSEGPSLWSKAAIVHARTLEVMDAMGLATEAVARGRKVHGLGFYSGDKRVGHVSVDGLDSPFPFMLGLSQRETEVLLEQHVRRLGGDVERRVELVGLKQVGDEVSATLLHHDGAREVVTSAFLVGCDGAHSLVRKTLEIPFEGASYEETILQADVRIRWPFQVPEDEGLFFVSPKGALGALPVLAEGRYRLLVLLARDEEYDPTLDNFRWLMEARGPAGAVVDDPAWMVAFRFHHRMVGRYRVGRVFLAGDAAHVLSPVGGQGMNMGIQDAFNLAWKLALVVRGKARPAYLDSYQAERSPVSEATLGITDAATRFGARALGLHSPLAQRLRDQLFGLASRLPMIEARAAALLGGLVVDYRSSPIVDQHVLPIWPSPSSVSLLDRASFEEGPRPGQRVGDVELALPCEDHHRLFGVLHGTGHALLLFAGANETPAVYAALTKLARDVSATYGDVLRVLVAIHRANRPEGIGWEGPLILDAGGAVHRRFGARAECSYLVRPDGYVAYRSQPADEEKLMAYLASVFVV